MAINSAGFENLHGQQSLHLFLAFGGIDVTHGKGSIAPYFVFYQQRNYPNCNRPIH